MPSATNRIKECQTVSSIHDMNAMRESVSLMLPALKSLSTDGDTAFVAKNNRYLHMYIAPNLSKLLCELLDHIEEGGDITLEPNYKVVSISEAAEVLNVTEPYLLQQLDEGKISFKTVNGRKLVEARSLYSFKRKFDREADKCLDRIVELTRELY